MNYQKVYDNIITRAQSEHRKKLAYNLHKDYVYYENHHIIPRCIGGLDTIENLVLLTAKEHFLCHKLLTYIFPKKPGIILAFRLMASDPYKLYNVSSRDYKYSKELYNSLPASEKTKKKRLEAWFETNCSPEAVDKYLDSLKGTHYSPDFDRSIHISFK